MVSSTFALAASSILSLCIAAPIPSLVEPRRAFSGYKVFGGDGTVAQGWPAQNDWWTFEQLWDANLPILSKSCAQYPGSPPDNSQEEIAAIKTAIEEVSGESGVAKEFILIFMMQESKGCVRAPTTNYGVRNPGLMQSFNGKSTCNEGGFTTPCPDSTIKSMISEGTGIGLEFGITQAIEQGGSSNVDKYYKAARIYNSGSLPASGNLGDGIATHCYASDIANRLLGWVDQTSSCEEGTIGSIGGSPGPVSPPETPETPEPSETPVVPEPSETPVVPEPTPAPEPTKEPVVPEPAPTSTPAPAPPAPTTSPAYPTPPSNPSNGNTPAQPPKEEEPEQQPPTSSPPSSGGALEKAPGASANCKKWFDVKKGDDCRTTGIDFQKLRALNTEIDSKCSNLWAGYSYCIEA